MIPVPVLPQETARLHGHSNVLKSLQTAFDQNKMHHGQLILGPKGVGKETLVYQFVKIILGKNDLDATRKIVQGSHPNVLTIGRSFDEKKGKKNSEIKVDDIQPLFNFLQQTSANNQWRFVIIDDADHMNRSVQNRILKTLEEPPYQTVIFLIAENKHLLLPTILSRCQIKPLMPLPFDDVKMLLSAQGLEENADLYAAFSEGCFGRGLDLAQQEAAQIWQEWCDVLEASFSQRHSTVMDFAENYGIAKNDDLYQVLKIFVGRLLIALIRTKTGIAKAEDAIMVQSLSPSVQDYFLDMRELTLLNLHDHVIKELREGERSYLDRKLVLLSIIQDHVQMAKSVAF